MKPVRALRNNDPKEVTPKWEVKLSPSARKQMLKLPAKVAATLASLIGDMENDGPIQKGWANFSTLKKGKKIPSDSYHCHIKRGRPTYVACWQAMDKKIKIMEIFYVGTHESAPY
jgi:mRNA-degrading endonuclease RelE of RelBE toxin-antitoxin system